MLNIGDKKHNLPASIVKFALILLFFCPLESWGLDAETVIKKLDNHYYYVQDYGLKKLTATVQWELNQKIKYFWKYPDKERFEVIALDDQQNRKEAILDFIENYRDTFVPKKVTDTLAGYRLKRMTDLDNMVYLKYVTKEQRQKIKEYTFWVDKEKFRIRKMEVSVGDAVISNKMTYIKKKGKWLVSSIHADYRRGGKTIPFLKSDFFYKKVRNFWLLSKITREGLTENAGKLDNSIVLRINEYKTYL
jgi:outer membrane lipoprotein-sorting protein|tara:strand:- start:275 stop:1018 length:744 start_codon:yes stop_codon:yes gene_type:complete